MKIPNFFIVGAPKCGTTALSQYLRCHQKIFMSFPKEPYFFADDFPLYRTSKSIGGYLYLFKECTNKHLAVGEASAVYLYSSVAIRNIYQFNKFAKIIVMLRNPVDMVYSLHSQLLVNFDEDEKDFKTAWNQQSIRKMGVNIPKNCLVPLLLQYSKVGMLGDQVERLLNIFPSDQIKIILFDDFRMSTKSIYNEVLSFLDVPSDERTIFPRINENAMYRSFYLAYLLKYHFHLDYLPDNLKIFDKVKNKIAKLNSRKEARKPLNLDFRSELCNVFKKDVNKLSRIINKDLSHWIT